MDTISIVVSCYNEEKAIPIFFETTEKTINEDFGNDVKFEYVFIDDGSTDRTLDVIRELSRKDERIKYVSFSRNFGKEAAMQAGLEHASGNYVTLMDADLQDPPSLLKNMYDIIKNEGYEQVGTKRVSRKGEPVIRSIFARMFYKLINKMSNVEMTDGARDYRMMTRKVVDSILKLKECNRYSKGLFSFVGFKTKWIEYENLERSIGETKWSFWSLFKYAIEGITAFSTVPLVCSSIIGLLFCIISFFMIAIIIIKTLCFGDPTTGWPSMVCIIFFVSGIQLFSIGIIGQYLSKVYLEVKKRPNYIIMETNCTMNKKTTAH